MKKNIFFILFFIGLMTACSESNVGPEAGQNLAVMRGCSACHSVDETDKIGPTWVGLYGSEVELVDGTIVTADDDYLIESIEDPNAKIVKGFSRGSMPPLPLTNDEINSLVTYIKNVK